VGTTLHAQVELLQPGSSWFDLARWDFGKDYNASIALYNCPLARRGWPKDGTIEPEEAEIFDEGRQWIEARYLPVVPESRPIWRAFEASLLVLIDVRPDPPSEPASLRVLFWRM
jgi:hypothetical protein